MRQYAAMCELGELRHCSKQLGALKQLEALRERMADHHAATLRYAADCKIWREVVRKAEEARVAAEAAEAAKPLWVRAFKRLRSSMSGAVNGESSSAAAAADTEGLTAEERDHPFWRQRLGDPEPATAPAKAPLPAGVPPPPPRPPAPTGIFIYGGVGAGKTMLMDLLAASLASDASDRAACGRESTAPMRVRRVHHAAFMVECHKRLHAHSLQQRDGAFQPKSAEGSGCSARTAGAANGTPAAPPGFKAEAARGWGMMTRLVSQLVTEDARAEESTSLEVALKSITREIIDADESDVDGVKRGADVHADVADGVACAGVLCFDEVQVMDIADATITRGVLDALVSAGWVIVATCNRDPSALAGTLQHKEHPQARRLYTERIIGHALSLSSALCCGGR